MSQENVEILRGGYEALGEGNVDAVLQICDPDIEIQLPEGGINTGTRRGHHALGELLNSYIEAFESFRLEPEKFFETGDQVVVFVRAVARGRGSGLEVNTATNAHLWTLHNGKAVRVEVFPDGGNRAALEAAGLSE